MARNRETKIELTAYDDLFQTDESREDAKLSKIRDIPISQIDEFPDHPFKVLMNTEKYTLKSSKIYMPARIDAEAEKRIQEAAVTIYKALGCSGFSRVDMFYTPSGEIVFNEVNTIPGFTSHSRYPNMMKGIGLSFSQMLDKLIGLYVE